MHSGVSCLTTASFWLKVVSKFVTVKTTKFMDAALGSNGGLRREKRGEVIRKLKVNSDS